MSEVDVIREKLLGHASNDLAVKQQQLAERQATGKNVKAATSEVSQALERVERLQEGVNYVAPASDPELRIAQAAAAIITVVLDGEGAAAKHIRQLLKLQQELHDALPEESRKHFYVTRQGAPLSNGNGHKAPTTSFDTGRTISAEDKDAAIETLIEAGDECADPHGETPPLEDGEVVVVLGMKNRVVTPDKVWVERVKRPVFQGVAPHDNSGDKRFN